MARLRITLKKSAIGYNKNQKKVVRALGFHRLHEVVEHDDSPQINGMIRKVRHLVECQVIPGKVKLESE